MLATSVVSFDREIVELGGAGTGTGVKAGLDAGLDLQAPGRGPHARLVGVGRDAAGLVVGLHLHDAISSVWEGCQRARGHATDDAPPVLGSWGRRPLRPVTREYARFGHRPVPHPGTDCAVPWAARPSRTPGGPPGRVPRSPSDAARVAG